MFEFGRDLRRLFAQARESEDLSWLELIGVDLLAVEARQQCTDAGRISCVKPHPAWMRGSALWREHARRSGSADSVRKALGAALDAARHAKSPDEVARAAVETAQGLLLRFDLNGGREVLDQALEAVPGTTGCRSATISLISAIHARIKSRLARFENDSGALMGAAALLDAAIHDMDRTRAGNVDDIRMDRAALALEAGVTRRDPHLLDQAGRELLRLVANASPDYRPLTRARALTLCGAGLSALGALADSEPAREQGKAMFEAAADQFTPDHSPLDWVVIQIVRGATPGAVSLAALRQADSLTAGQNLVVGAMARDMLIEGEVAAAVSTGDVPRLTVSETAARRRLSDNPSELNWAVEQMAMVRIARARALLTGSDASATGLALLEAAEVAYERGMPGLADRAKALLGVRLNA
ncbi:MAG TPA: hypothetical protein VF633_09485 [Brevundimonas sp.]|jgi:hypothetical protein